jgi:hypothetical protein
MSCSVHRSLIALSPFKELPVCCAERKGPAV